MKIRITPSIKSGMVAILFFAVVLALRADTITVTNTNDSGPGSLHQALADANDGDTIDFAVTATNRFNQWRTLGRQEYHHLRTWRCRLGC
jgi:hypothetical protein